MTQTEEEIALLARMDERLVALRKDFERMHFRIGGDPSNNFTGIEDISHDNARNIERLQNAITEIRKLMTGNGGKKSFEVIFLEINHDILLLKHWTELHDERTALINLKKEKQADNIRNLWIAIVLLILKEIVSWIWGRVVP